MDPVEDISGKITHEGTHSGPSNFFFYHNAKFPKFLKNKGSLMFHQSREQREIHTSIEDTE